MVPIYLVVVQWVRYVLTFMQRILTVYPYIQTLTHIHCPHTHTPYIHTHIHTHIHIYIYIYICIHIHTYTYIHIHTCTNTCVCVHAYAYMFPCLFMGTTYKRSLDINILHYRSMYHNIYI